MKKKKAARSDLALAPMLAADQLQQARLFLATSKRIAITSHRGPDADALGSSLAMMHTLEAAGHQVCVLLPDAFPEFLGWMPQAQRVLFFDKNRDEVMQKLAAAELLIALDYNAFDRLGDMAAAAASSPAEKWMIDHHQQPANGFALSVSRVDASSTCELVHTFISELFSAESISPDVAQCLYAGIMTDTGSFRFPGTSASTHRVVAQLMEVGLQPSAVHEAIYDQWSANRLKLIGFALTHRMRFFADAGITILALSAADKQLFACQKGDTEGLVNYGLSIKGSRMAVFLSEELGYVKFSLRSKGDVDVNQLARQHFNGGGHKNAAGGRLEGTLGHALSITCSALNLETFSW